MIHIELGGELRPLAKLVIGITFLAIIAGQFGKLFTFGGQQ